MTITPATPDMPAVTVEHGVGFLVLTLRRGRESLGTVLHPDAARALGNELHEQADEADRLLARIHPPSP